MQDLINCTSLKQNIIPLKTIYKYRRLVSLVGKAPVYRAGGSDSIPDRTNTQGLKIIEKVLPLL